MGWILDITKVLGYYLRIGQMFTGPGNDVPFLFNLIKRRLEIVFRTLLPWLESGSSFEGRTEIRIGAMKDVKGFRCILSMDQEWSGYNAISMWLKCENRCRYSMKSRILPFLSATTPSFHANVN